MTHKILLIMLVVIGVSLRVQAQNGERFIVAPDSSYPSITIALEAAQDGDTIEVHAGLYAETPLDITKSVQLIGIDNPVIDAGGEGTALIISADNVLFKGFTIRNTGMNNSHEDSGIVIQADHVTVEDNLLEDVLFGIYFADAEYGTARNNIVRGYDWN
jgi:nitrous oxidase accessory protein